MDNCLFYRRYDVSELGGAFFASPLFYTRSAQLRARCPGRPDTVSVFFEEWPGSGRVQRAVKVVADVQHHTDLLNEVLGYKGFTWIGDETGGRWRKMMVVPAGEGRRALEVLTKVRSGIDQLVNALPVCLYETRQSRRLREYLWVMTEAVTVARRELDQLLAAPPSPGAEARVAALADGRWAAWQPGDDYVPVFATAGEARRFAEQRRCLCRDEMPCVPLKHGWRDEGQVFQAAEGAI